MKLSKNNVVTLTEEETNTLLKASELLEEMYGAIVDKGSEDFVLLELEEKSLETNGEDIETTIQTLENLLLNIGKVAKYKVNYTEEDE